MNNVENNISKGLLKRLQALEKHLARKQKFVKAREMTREMIMQNIEEARNIWEKTLE